jgi:hypothetical protein
MRSIWMALSVGLLAIASPAVADEALTGEQVEAINASATMLVAGMSCPHIHSITAAGDQELATIVLDRSPEAMIARRQKAVVRLITAMQADQSGFCDKAWARLGPNGSRGHQMLEEDKLTDSQHDSLRMSLMAQFAGQGYRCPRFHLIREASDQELLDARIGPEAHSGGEYDKEFFTVSAAAEQQHRPEFCREAWQMLGPNGSYQRQMLEAN